MLRWELYLLESVVFTREAGLGPLRANTLDSRASAFPVYSANRVRATLEHFLHEFSNRA